MALAQRVLFPVVRHHTGDFAGATTDTLLSVGHNKTIHNNTCFGSITLFFRLLSYLPTAAWRRNVQMPVKPNYFQ